MDSKGDLINQKRVPLDANLIADILSVYLRSEPTTEPFILPDFRVEGLCKKIESDCRDEIVLLEIIGSIYALAMYCAIAPAIYPHLVRRCASIFMCIIGESLSYLEVSRRITFSHPIDTVLYQRYTLYMKDVLYDTFRYSLDTAREVLRDITRPVRLARDKSNKTGSNRLPTDAVQAHTILFMSTFALSHIACLLSSENQLNDVPGIRETLLLLMTMKLGTQNEPMDDIRVPNSCPQPKDDQPTGLEKASIRTYFLVRSLTLTSRLSCIAAQLVIERQQLHAVSAV